MTGPIDPEKVYSLSDVLKLAAQGYFPVRSRVTLIKLAKQGKISYIDKGVNERPAFAFKGEALIAFMNAENMPTQP